MRLVRWLRTAIESSRREKQDWERVNATLATAVRAGRFDYWRPLIPKKKEER